MHAQARKRMLAGRVKPSKQVGRFCGKIGWGGVRRSFPDSIMPASPGTTRPFATLQACQALRVVEALSVVVGRLVHPNYAMRKSANGKAGMLSSTARTSSGTAKYVTRSGPGIGIPRISRS